ncbi:flavin reductase family protein [Spirillospora sp. NPDC050679]
MQPPADLVPVPVDPVLFRQVTGRFATGVAIVSTVAGGADHAMTVNSFTSVSLDPPLVLVCVDRTSRFHGAVLDGGLWAVSVLGAGQRTAAERFATRGRPLEGQFEDCPHRRGPGTGAVLLSEALATIECRTHAVHDGGDHAIVVGRVLGLDLPDPDGEPLVFHAGAYRAIA